MKKIALLVTAMMLITGSAFGVMSEGTTHWELTSPEQTVSVYAVTWNWTGTITSVFTTGLQGAFNKTFDLTVSGSVVTFTETNNETPTPDLYGVGTYAGTGPYTVTTNATTGQYVDPWVEVTLEYTIDPFTMNAAEDTITNGVMNTVVGPIGDMWTPYTFTALADKITIAEGDFDNDDDVDGSDLEELAADLGLLSLSEFSANFGRAD